MPYRSIPGLRPFYPGLRVGARERTAGTLTVDRRYRQQAHLFNESRGIWDAGVWYSNDSYRPLLRSSRRHHGFTDPGGDEPTGWPPASSPPLRCVSCGALTDAEEAWCAWCDGCWACGELPARCICWAPEALRHQRRPGSPRPLGY